mmetsp:Transcript_7671/g.16876  ORF Transcript_7671/g.16876 Transcript_7671/m.16876 type:complete len:380 (+) Transcript_7671:80-1219(+)
MAAFSCARESPMAFEHAYLAPPSTTSASSKGSVKNSMWDDSELKECVICLDQTCKSVVLPCDCRADYCLGCWDRALAQSLSSCGQARCPTCRAAVRVDYDAESGNLIFTRDCEESSKLADEEEGVDVESQPLDRREALRRRTLEARSKLVEQAKPAQVRLLRELGASVAASVRAGKMPGCSPDERPSDGPVMWTETLGVPPTPADFMRFGHLTADLDSVSLLTPACTRPSCVCGGYLERVPHRERARRWLRRLGYQNLERVVEMVTAKGVSTCTCDLCGEPVDPGGYVWTCEKANRAILHTNDWDVCDACFDLYTNELEVSTCAGSPLNSSASSTCSATSSYALATALPSTSSSPRTSTDTSTSGADDSDRAFGTDSRT